MPFSFSQEQVDVGNTILRVGQQMGATAHQIRAAFAAAWVESRMRNLPFGDRDSLGVFQQRPSQGWGTPGQVQNVEYAARKFFEGAMRVSNAGTPGQLAQRVQRSAFPLRYDEQIAAPDELLARLSQGGSNPTAHAVGGAPPFAGVASPAGGPSFFTPQNIVLIFLVALVLRG